MNSSVSKWSCPLCTFQNWPKSNKCTVCLAPRDISIIENGINEIDLTCTNGEKTPDNSWTCSRCTFLNSSTASSKCIQCSQMSELCLPKISDSIVSSCAYEITTDLELPVKWKCTACTFDNWPKSQKCVMCTSPNPAFNNPESEVNSNSFNFDSLWIDACKAVILGDLPTIKTYLLKTRNYSRKLNISECDILHSWFTQITKFKNFGKESSSEQCWNNCTVHPNSPFKPEFTLFQIDDTFQKIRLQESFMDPKCNYNESVTSMGLEEPTKTPLMNSCIRNQVCGKQSICDTSPFLAKELRKSLSNGMCQNKIGFACVCLSEWGTFSLPTTIRDLPSNVQELLFSQICDTEVQAELEERSEAINWWVFNDRQPTSRLFALWNRTDGDCLLDSLFQSSWGILDRQNSLRQALTESLIACESTFFRIWRDYELKQAADQYRPDDCQLLRDWGNILQTAMQPRSSLEQIHIFVLCHILRCVIIVYGVKYINNYRNEPIGISNFQGLYIPFLWDRSVCSRNPLVLGYTRGHFSALVPMEPPAVNRVSVNEQQSDCCTQSGRQSAPLFKTNLSSEESNSAVHLLKSHSNPRPKRVGKKHESHFSQTNCKHTSNDSSEKANAMSKNDSKSFLSIYLPLFDRHGAPLPVHFISEPEASNELITGSLNTVSTKRGLLLARMRPTHNHLVTGIIDDWLTNYQNLSTQPQTSVHIADTESFTTSNHQPDDC